MSNLNLANYLMAGIALVLCVLCYLIHETLYAGIFAVLGICCIAMLVANYRKERKSKQKFHVKHHPEE